MDIPDPLVELSFLFRVASCNKGPPTHEGITVLSRIALGVATTRKIARLAIHAQLFTHIQRTSVAFKYFRFRVPYRTYVCACVSLATRTRARGVTKFARRI